MRIESIECEGAPRDLGLVQGEACRAAIRDRVARSGLRSRRRLPLPRRLAGGAVLGAGAGLAVMRHYPHLAERMTGLARASEMPLDLAMELLLMATYEPHQHALGQAAVGCAVAGDAGTSLARAVHWPSSPGSRPIVRRSRPEVGFGSVELTLPWLVSALAGVNDKGLAVSWIPRATRDITPDSPTAIDAPNLLLVQECLQRFDRIEGALEWCLNRPSRGDATLHLAHASGEVAAVECRGAEREIVRPEEARLVSAAEPAHENVLVEQLSEGAALLPAAVSAAVGGVTDSAVVILDAKRGALALWTPEQLTGAEPSAPALEVFAAS